MPSTPTPILGLTVPTVGGDANSWGTELNTDFSILDNLGAVAVVIVNSNTVLSIPVFPETVVRITTGAGTVTTTIPNPAVNQGKVYTCKKIDAALGTAKIVATGGATIDGATEWDLTNQYAFVRLYSNGVTYDVIGTG